MSQPQQTYYAVFFDIEEKLELPCGSYKSIDKKTFHTLVDGIEGKTVYLKDHAGAEVNHNILTVKLFHKFNTVDNEVFVICDVKKIK